MYIKNVLNLMIVTDSIILTTFSYSNENEISSNKKKKRNVPNFVSEFGIVKVMANGKSVKESHGLFHSINRCTVTAFNAANVNLTTMKKKLIA